MSTTVLPSLKGFDIGITRSSMFKTNKPQAVSGKEVAIAKWSSPRYQWTIAYNFLRQGTFNGNFTELATLRGFFEQLLGGYDSWLYTDPNDNAVVGQALGVTTGAAGPYQLQRSSGGATMPILAPNLGATFNLYVNGRLQSGAFYSVTDWSSSTPGQITFAGGHVPSAALPLTADFTYYFPCRFDADNMDFDRFAKNIYDMKKVTFTSIK